MFSDLYNNEIIGSIGVFSVINELSPISCAKVMLILPFLFHNDLVRYLNHSSTKVKSIEQLILKKPEFISNFNERFYDLIETSFNSILILNSLDIIYINKDGKIMINEGNKNKLLKDLTKNKIGIRASNMVKASQKLAYLLTEDVDNLYLQLRVKL